MKRKLALTNGIIYTGTDILKRSSVLIHDDTISQIVDSSAIPEGYEVIDLHGANLCPGFIDLQIYGWGDQLFSAALTSETLAKIEESLLKQGTTSFYLTLATNEISVFKEAIQVCKGHDARNMLGLHLEGPFLNPSKRGAHPENLIFSPTVSDLQDLLHESLDVVKMMTVAPEILSDEALAYLLSTNLTLSAGHSNASLSEATRGFEKGIHAITHMWNAMSPLHHREGGLPAAVSNHKRVFASIIVDGIHVDYEVVKLSKVLLGERLFLITDAVASCQEGIYQHILNGDHYVLPDGTLSGSALTMIKAVQNCVEHAGFPLDEAIRMATLYPAKLIGREDLGKITIGSKANLVVFDREYKTKKIFFEGEIV